jgi:hypothetical protein
MWAAARSARRLASTPELPIQAMISPPYSFFYRVIVKSWRGLRSPSKLSLFLA